MNSKLLQASHGSVSGSLSRSQSSASRSQANSLSATVIQRGGFTGGQGRADADSKWYRGR